LRFGGSVLLFVVFVTFFLLVRSVKKKRKSVIVIHEYKEVLYFSIDALGETYFIKYQFSIIGINKISEIELI
jgi:hypothetical protein